MEEADEARSSTGTELHADVVPKLPDFILFHRTQQLPQLPTGLGWASLGEPCAAAGLED